MITKIYISSIEQAELKPYRTLRQSVEHFRDGIFIAEGEKVVRRLFESELEVVSVLITPEWYKVYQEYIADHPRQITVFIGKKELLETIVGFNLHQGIMATGRIPSPASIPSVLAKTLSPRVFIAIDGLTNSENIGVLVRNCAAFGVHCILVGETSSSPYLRRAVRNSMGTVFKVPIVHCINLIETLRTLRDQNSFSIVAAHPHTEQRLISSTDFSKNCCVVFGSEGNGISPDVLEVCNVHSAIPMQLGVDSLNVASASAVFLYEVMRQQSLQ
jgi:tRNA G18 (ribose-2'-O)-methylase SpoU